MANIDIDEIMRKAKKTAAIFRKFNQEQTDKIVKAVYEAGFNNRVQLAKLAHQETKLGVWTDKVFKNVIATHYLYNDIKDLKTVGIISEEKNGNVLEIAKPIGPIFAVTPITNPTSTILFKILISLKTRNPIIIRPHGAAKKSSIKAARICYEAALNAGAPENCIQWIKRSSQEETIAFMRHKNTALILATGSVGLVKAAYSSGNPAIGIGPGNVPVYIGESADVPFAVKQIFLSKTFDNGTVCASEQAMVVKKCHVEEVIKQFKKHKAHFLSEEEISRLEPVAFNKVNNVMNVEVIGQPAAEIAKMAKIDVPSDTTMLIAKLDKVGIESPLSLEILAPILAFYVAEDFEHGIKICREINLHGGLGHTVSIFSRDEEKIKYFAEVMNAGRIVINTPSSQGALGGSFNILQPSLTLGCGTGGNNITADNISAKHLLNIQRIAKRKTSKCLKCSYLNQLRKTIDAEDLKKKCEEC